MPAPLSDLIELPIEILERILLCLPSQDIVKIERVRSVTEIFIRTFVDITLHDLGQPAYSRPRSQLTQPPAPTRALRHRSDL